MAESHLELEWPDKEIPVTRNEQDEKAYLETMSKHFRLKELYVRRKKSRKRLAVALIELGTAITLFLVAMTLTGGIGVIERVVGIFIITVIFTLLYQPLFFGGYGTKFHKKNRNGKFSERFLDGLEEMLFKRV